MPNEENPQGFVRSKLPWILAGGALLLFLVTLNHWVNLRSLAVAAKVTGWDWVMPVQSPLLYTLSFPIRFLPASIQPLALNVFTAVCAALTLALLARSVALLPHDRTHEQRIRERSDFSLLSIKLAWVPPVLAVLACALQLTFWEHATAFTGEIFDLLLFAYVIRCLLEYRISQEERWMSKLAIVYGLGVTNNWALIGFFPLFLAAIIWIKGLRFFDPGFLLRMVGLGLCGLLLYLLLPTVWVFRGSEDVTFWEVLQANLTNQKLFLVDTRILRNRALLLGLTSVLPVALIGIRWPTSFGDTSAAGATLTNLAFRIIHLFFLGACIWVVFDPKYSPRQLGMNLPFLSFYYLGALAIGYYSGYALLVFSEAPRKQRRRDDSIGKLFNPIVRLAVLAALVAVPAALAYKNYSAIQAGNGSILRDFAERTGQLLPNQPAYLLSEDAYQLALVQGALESKGERVPHVFVNTRSLETPAYHVQMRKRYGERWPQLVDPSDLPLRVSQVDLQQMVRSLAASNQVIYLHPSFGYFFEALYPVPNGQVYSLKPFAADEVFPPGLTDEQLRVNTSFWSEPREYLERVSRLATNDSPDARYLARYYSRALNAWGVTLQRAGKMVEAGQQFAQAVDLNTNNAPARLNHEFNQAFLANNVTPFDLTKAEEMLGGYTSFDQLLSENGPLDHPDLCYYLGVGFLTQSQFRQAALQFSRTAVFQPTNHHARVNIAKSLVNGGWIEEGLAEVAKIEKDFPALPPRAQADLASIRAAAFYAQKNLPKAEEVLIKAREAQPDNPVLTDSLLDLYRAAGQVTNALALLDKELTAKPTNQVVRIQKAEVLLALERFDEAHTTLDQVLTAIPNHIPAMLYHAFAYIQEKKYDEALARVERILQIDQDNVQALTYKGIIHMEQKAFDKAREAFDDVLEKDPTNVTVRRNRGILNMRSERWSEAKEDYEELRKLAPKSHAVLYGLAEVAYHQNDRKAAERFYEAYLKNAPASGGPELEEERSKVQARLQELKSGK